MTKDTSAGCLGRSRLGQARGFRPRSRPDPHLWRRRRLRCVAQRSSRRGPRRRRRPASGDRRRGPAPGSLEGRRGAPRTGQRSQPGCRGQVCGPCSPQPHLVPQDHRGHARRPKTPVGRGASRRLAPLVLAGSWSDDAEGDRTAIAMLTGRDYSDVEGDLAGMVRAGRSTLVPVRPDMAPGVQGRHLEPPLPASHPDTPQQIPRTRSRWIRTRWQVC